jgi:hypothetical protein
MTRKHNVSESEYVSVLRRGKEDTYSDGPLERANLNHWTNCVDLEMNKSN